MYSRRIFKLNPFPVGLFFFSAGTLVGGLGGLFFGMMERSIIGICGGLFLGLLYGIFSGITAVLYAALFNIISPLFGGIEIAVETEPEPIEPESTQPPQNDSQPPSDIAETDKLP